MIPQAFIDELVSRIDLPVMIGLGFAPDQWDALSSNKAFRSKALIESGLAVSRTEGKGIYDRFRSRVMFPILDHQGRTIGFGGRHLGDGDGPKYLNSPETKLYQKSAVLFGLHQAKTAIRQLNHVIVAEGYFDVVTPAQHGVENVVSTCGTAMTEVQAEILRSVADRVTCCFDGDAAGSKATWAAATLLVPRVNDVHEIRLCRLPAGHDPDSLVREHGPKAVAEAVEAAPTLVDYLTGAIARGARSAEARSRAVHAAITQWRNFAAPAMKLFYRQSICTALAISEDSFDQLAAKGVGATPGDTSLRHCPFCGGRATLVAQDMQHVVACAQCGITTPPVPTFENAHNLWNRRKRIRHAA
ncbi:MAG: toprim domain-containing protein [Sulfuritalea sp.]|nr:toprim domain-containing protein [Sulfuritalea sp.]